MANSSFSLWLSALCTCISVIVIHTPKQRRLAYYQTHANPAKTAQSLQKRSLANAAFPSLGKKSKNWNKDQDTSSSFRLNALYQFPFISYTLALYFTIFHRLVCTLT